MEAVKDVLKEEIIQCPREENLQKEKPHPSLENLLAEGHEVCQRRMLKGHTLDLVKAKNTMKKSSKLLAHSPKRNIRGQKTSKKLLGLIRFDRHKRIRKSICSTKTKTEWADSRPSFCRHRRHYILKEKHVQDTSQGQSSYRQNCHLARYEFVRGQCVRDQNDSPAIDSPAINSPAINSPAVNSPSADAAQIARVRFARGRYDQFARGQLARCRFARGHFAGVRSARGWREATLGYQNT